MQPEEETRVCEGQASRARPPQAAHLVRGSAPGTFWASPAGGNRQKFREEGWGLVRPLDSGTHTTVRVVEEALFLFSLMIYTLKH